jgi:hypothetical protein
VFKRLSTRPGRCKGKCRYRSTIPDFVFRQRCIVSFTPQTHYPQYQSGRCGEEKNLLLLLCWESNPTHPSRSLSLYSVTPARFNGALNASLRTFKTTAKRFIYVNTDLMYGCYGGICCHRIWKILNGFFGKEFVSTVFPIRGHVEKSHLITESTQLSALKRGNLLSDFVPQLLSSKLELDLTNSRQTGERGWNEGSGLQPSFMRPCCRPIHRLVLSQDN